MKMRKPSNREYILLGAFILVAAFPLATGPDGMSLALRPLGDVLASVSMLDLVQSFML